MTDLKKEETRIVTRKFPHFNGWSILLGFMLIATTAGGALAYNSRARGHTFDDTFTKWVRTSPPAPGMVAIMVGVAGGDVGSQRFW